MAVKSFTIYEEYFDLITLLDIEEQKDLVMAIIEYMFKDKEPILNERQNKIFKNLKRPLDISKNNSTRRIKPKENQKETKKEPNKNRKGNQIKTHQDVIVNVNNYINIYKYIEEVLNITLSGTNYLRIEELLKIYNDEILCYAVDQTLASGHKTLNYFFGIVNNWKQDNLKTLEEIKKNNKKNKRVVPEWINKEVDSTASDDTDFKSFVEEFRNVNK